MKTSRRGVSRAALKAVFDKLDHRAQKAVTVILELVVDLEDRRRAMKLIEAVSTLVTFAPRRRRPR